MTTSWGQTLDEKGESKKRWAALLSVLVTLSMLLVEIGVYLLTGSLAVLGDAAHSLNDLAAALLSYWGCPWPLGRLMPTTITAMPSSRTSHPFCRWACWRC